MSLSLSFFKDSPEPDSVEEEAGEELKLMTPSILSTLSFFRDSPEPDSVEEEAGEKEDDPAPSPRQVQFCEQ